MRWYLLWSVFGTSSKDSYIKGLVPACGDTALGGVKPLRDGICACFSSTLLNQEAGPNGRKFRLWKRALEETTEATAVSSFSVFASWVT